MLQWFGYLKIALAIIKMITDAIDKNKTPSLNAPIDAHTQVEVAKALRSLAEKVEKGVD